MKKILLPLILLLLACQPRFDVGSIESEIRGIIAEQQAAWNAGDFEGFMACYWNSDQLTFQSGNTRRIGWQTLLDMYRTNYAGDKRGMLTFSDIEVKVLSEDMVLVLGRWNVTTAEDEKEGLYTLIFRKLTEGWRIIHDHSSG